MSVKLHTVDVVVADMASSVAFYRALGLSIAAGEEGSAHVEVSTPDGLSLGLDAEHAVLDVDSRWRPPQGGQRVSMQFECGSPAEVDAVYDRLVKLGAGSYRPPWDAFWGQRFGRVTDPDGNVISLFAAL